MSFEPARPPASGDRLPSHASRSPSPARALAPGSTPSLPDLARRYLDFAMEKRSNTARWARLHMAGRLRPGGSARMVPFRSVVTFLPPEPPRLSLFVRYGALEVKAVWADDGLRWRLFDVVALDGPLAGPRAGAGCAAPASSRALAAVAVLFPPYLLPSCGAGWRILDGESARVRIALSRQPVELVVRIDSSGRLIEAASLPSEVTFDPLCIDQITGHRAVGGYRLASAFRAAWQRPGGVREPLLHARITGVRFG